jgi:hypothetical protein
MTQWEYRQLRGETVIRHAPRCEENGIEEVLNGWGAEGWDVMDFTVDKGRWESTQAHGPARCTLRVTAWAKRPKLAQHPYREG